MFRSMDGSSDNGREPNDGLAADAWRTDQERWAGALSQAPAFGEAIGRQLQLVREGKGRTAEEVAKRARQVGLSWHRPTVGQIERGRRALSAVELIMLPLIYGVPLGELLPEGVIWLTPEVGVYDREVRRVLGGDHNPSSLALRAPGGWHVRGVSDRPSEEALEMVQALTASPWPHNSDPRYVQDKPDEAEVKAAKRLDTTPHFVAYAAREFWGHGLAAEREARLSERGELPEGKRALQSARGHITRVLLAELEPVVRGLEVAPRQGDLDPTEPGALEDRQKGRETGG